MIIEQSRSPEEALKQRHFRRRGIPRREFRANEIVIDYCSLKHGSRRITAWLGLIRAMPRSGEGTVVLFPVKKEEREREREKRGYRAPCSSAGEPANSAALFDLAAGSSYSLFSCSFWLDGTSQHFNGIPRSLVFEEELWGCPSVRLVIRLRVVD